MPSSADMAATPSGRLWFLAALPPPVNGQANCNAAMRTLLSKTLRLRGLALGGSSFGKIFRALMNCWTLLRKAGNGDALYVSIPGQQGAWLLLPAIMAARLRALPIWFHHHSFRSINQGPMWPMRVLIAGAGPQQHHILLSDKMCDRFAGLYLGRNGGRAQAMSNTVLFSSEVPYDLAPRTSGPPVLGHLSVLTPQKGVLYLIALFDELTRRIPGIRLVIAGPSNDAQVLAALQSAKERHPETFEYRGQIGGSEKEQFFQDIDLFVLPTTLVDEAEPLVVIEAYSHGVDVFATSTGCIPDRMRKPELLLSLNHMDDVERIAKVARTISIDWHGRRAACQAHVARIRADCREQGVSVLARLHDSIRPLRYGPKIDPTEAMKANLP